jgi:hypothetical protein
MYDGEKIYNAAVQEVTPVVEERKVMLLWFDFTV